MLSVPVFLDIAVTARCYRNALQNGDGIPLPYWE